MTQTPPLPPLSPDDWPEEIDALRDGFASRLNVYRTMAHHPALLNAWAGLRRHVVLESSLGPELLEIVILRIAARLGSQYEWSHHVSRSRAIGLGEARIQSMRGQIEAMADGDQLVAQSVDSLLDRTRLDQPVLSALTQMVGEQGVLDLMATAGFYKTLGCIVETYQVPLDDLNEEAPDPPPGT